ncbi:MAG: hypothetical protein WCP45_14450 [Verrucomicrobiota bacterium]
MSPRIPLLTFTVLGCLCGLAQESTPNPVPLAKPTVESGSILEFFDSLNNPYPSDEVVSQFSPPTPLPLITKSATPPAEPTQPADAQPAEPAHAAGPAERQPSLSVQVEKLQTGSGALDPKTVKLLAPFPAKPLATIPSGWRLESSNHAPPFIRKVELAPGASITLNIRPHLLVPDANGSAAFSIAEPGFDPALGYRQAQTVSAILASSIHQLDEDAKQLGHAIAQIQQLVSSLPQPAPKQLPIAPAPALAPTPLLKQANKK